MLKALQELRRIWDAEEWHPQSGGWFPTPGLIVSREDREGCGTEVTVCSEHAEEIGAMIRAVRNALLDDLDFYDQEDLYRRMGTAANRAIREGKECREILDCVLAEAEEVYDEWSRYLFFAYDELMGESVMRTVCPTAKRYGKAAADGYDIRLDAAGHLTAVPDSELFTEGVLWLLTQQELYLMEEYKNGTEDRFVKRSVIVTAGDELLSAHTYLSRNVKDRPDRPDGQYYDALEAAREASLSEPYISRMVHLEQV
ncbi:MAG: gamma-glutamylcyclotransferase [Clostridia bacterium]|nr:gamma-glutamylcyclotransferase [Clostridia bacterium]